jgi:hypothetical protein
LLAENDKRRRALAALDPRQRSAPEPKPDQVTASTKPAGQPPTAARNARANPTARCQRGKRRQRVSRTAPSQTEATVLAPLATDPVLTAAEVAATVGLSNSFRPCLPERSTSVR